MLLLHVERSMLASHLLLTMGWVLFGVIHSVAATTEVKRRMAQVMGNYFAYYRLSYSVVSLLLVAVLLFVEFTITSISLWQTPVLVKAIATLFAAAGLYIMIITSRNYFTRLSGVDVLTKTKSCAILETGGLHRFVRHPLYAGTLLFIWSLLFFSPMLSHALACFVITVYTLLGIKFEEKKLVAEYGEAYKHYKKRVPMIVPKLKS